MMKSCCGTFCCPVISPATSKQEQNECLAEKGKKKIRKHRSGINSMIASTTCLFTRINEGFFFSPRLNGLPVWQDFYDLFGRIFMTCLAGFLTGVYVRLFEAVF
jgi:hypothetical protein